MLRTRESSTTVSTTTAFQRSIRCNNEVIQLGGPYTVRSRPDYGWIQDRKGSSQLTSNGVSLPAMKPVEHKQWHVSGCTDAYSAVYNTCTGNQFALKQNFFTPASGLYSCMWPYHTYVGDVLVGSVFADMVGEDPAIGHYDRWLKCKPTMASRANLTVFLLELRDLKRMFEVLPDRHFHLKDWREVLRYGNGQHLNWNFGWSPFLRDISKIMEGLASFEARLKTFLREEGVMLTKHEREGESQSGIIQAWKGSQAPGIFYQVRRSMSKISRSTFQYTYDIPDDLDYKSLRWRAWLDTLGSTANISNIWAVLPWSFVVDWFVALGPYLKQFNSDWIEPKITFSQACSSVKKEGTASMDVRWTISGYERIISDFCSLSFKYYKRSIGFPAYVYSNPSALSADKIRLLFSLGLARLL